MALNCRKCLWLWEDHIYFYFLHSQTLKHYPFQSLHLFQFSRISTSTSISMQHMSRQINLIHTCNYISRNHLQKIGEIHGAATLLPPVISAWGSFPVRSGEREHTSFTPLLWTASLSYLGKKETLTKKKKLANISVLDCGVLSHPRWMNTATARLAHNL